VQVRSLSEARHRDYWTIVLKQTSHPKSPKPSRSHDVVQRAVNGPKAEIAIAMIILARHLERERRSERHVAWKGKWGSERENGS
jgi:hypothetical protein